MRYAKITLTVAFEDVGGTHPSNALDYILPAFNDTSELHVLDFDSQELVMVEQGRVSG